MRTVLSHMCHKVSLRRVMAFIAVACVMLLMVPRVAIGQTTFEWSTVRQDTLYTTIEECLALVTKVEGQTYVNDTIDQRYFPTRLIVAPNTTPAVVTTTARQCSEKIPVTQLLTSDSLNIPQILNVMRLFVLARRDAEMVALVEGAIAKLPASQHAMKTHLRELAATRFLEDYPTRFAMIRQLADSIDMTWGWKERINLYGQIMERARELKDTAQYEAAVSWLATMTKVMSDSIKKTDDWRREGPMRYVFAAQQYMHRAELLAKLRVSVDSFRLFMVLLSKEAGMGDGPDNAPIAKELVAHYWFPEKPTERRPSISGKVGIVFLVQGPVCNPCDFSKRRYGRLKQKFPELEYTLVTRTFGYFGSHVGLLPPEQEARMIDSFHRKLGGFPGVIAVHRTDFWRIDETYDRRQVEEVWALNNPYVLWGFGPSMLIVDQQGRFISPPVLDFDPEVGEELFFEALLRHKK